MNAVSPCRCGLFLRGLLQLCGLLYRTGLCRMAVSVCYFGLFPVSYYTNLLWIIGECQGYAVYLIHTIEKGIVLALAQYLQTTVATRPTPAFVFLDFLLAAGNNDHSKCPESWPVTQLNLLHSISTVRVMTTTSTSVGSVCCISTIKLINNRDTASPRMCINDKYKWSLP